MENERKKLEQMILNKEDYEKILKQSQILDEFINSYNRNCKKNESVNNR